MANLPISTERQQQIEQICLRLLARREHSQQELLDKLRLRGYQKQESEPVIAKMTDQNWQNDERFVESYARQRLQKGYGPLRIRYELQQRGIEQVDMEALAEENVGGWQNLLQSVYTDKYGHEKTLSCTEWLKRSRFLLQRGFTGEMIRTLLIQLNIKLK